MCLRGLWAQNIGSVLPAAVPVLSATPALHPLQMDPGVQPGFLWLLCLKNIFTFLSLPTWFGVKAVT